MSRKPRNFLVKIVTFVLFGLLIASFAIWGIGDIFRGPGRTSSVAKVGNVSIGQQVFLRGLSSELNRLSARFGGRIDMDQARAMGIVDQVLQGMVGRSLFDQEAAALGLVATDEQVRQRIQQEPAFQNDQGAFDRDRFVQTLQASNLGEQEYVGSLRSEILRQQIAGAVTGAIPVPDKLVDVLYRYREERRVARYVTVLDDRISDLPDPDEAALESFHKEFAGKFMAPEYRTLRLVRLRAEDLAAEVAVSEAQLRDEFAARREDFITPERRTIAQILFQDEAEAREAKARLSRGAIFANVAQEMTGQPPADLGATEQEDLLPEIAETAFGLELKVSSAPVQSPLGWHIFRVTKIEPLVERSFEEVREELARDTAMRLAVESMVSIANQLDDELAAGASLSEAAGRLNLPLRRIGAIDRTGKTPDNEPVPDLPGDRFLEVVFDTEPGTESLLTETSDGGYFILRVQGITPAHLKPLAQVRQPVIDLWTKAQRGSRARSQAEALAERVTGGVTLEAISAVEGYPLATTEPLTRFETGLGRSPSRALAAKLFQLKIGEVVTAAAPQGHILAKLIEIRTADPGQNREQVDKVRDGLANAIQSDVLEQFLATLRDQFGVSVNDALIADLLANL